MNTQKTLTQAVLADYTQPELIIAQLATRSIASVMQELADALHRQDSSASDAHLLSASVAALHQELLASRIADLGATFPHAPVASLSRPRFVLGRSSEPLTWLAPAFHPIDLVFLILAPANANAEFGQLAGTLRHLGRNEARLNELRRATTVAEMLAVFATIPLIPVSELVLPAPVAVMPHGSPGRAFSGYRRWRR